MWNKIIDPRNGKRVHVSSRRGMTVLRNYMHAQTGGHKGPCAVKSSSGRCGKSKASDGKCEVAPTGRCRKLAFSEEKLKPEYLEYDEHGHSPGPGQAHLSRAAPGGYRQRYPMYSIEYAASGRSKCKETGKVIPKGALRIGKWTKKHTHPQSYYHVPQRKVAWYRAACFFRMLKRVRKHNTFDITTCDGVGKLRPKDVAWLTAEVAKHDAWLNMPKSERPKPPRKQKSRR